MKYIFRVVGLAFLVSTLWAGSAARYLSSLDDVERNNAVIDLEWKGVHTQDMIKAENLWNTGKYEEAISLIEILESKMGDMCLGISWKNPIETEGGKWGTDVQVTPSGYDIVDIELVKATGNNNLFVVARGSYGPDTCWTLNISNNGGSSWSETFRWNLAGGYVLYDVDAGEYSSYIYVAYASSFNDTVWIRRFYETNGQYDANFGYKVAIGTNSDIREVNFEPNRGGFSQMYCSAINNNNALLYAYSDNDGNTWNLISTGVSDAYTGLDMDYGFMSGAQHYLWISYINQSGYVCAKARASGVWEDHLNLTPATWYTRIAQHGDTVLILYADTGNLRDLRYYITYNDGTNWALGFIYDSTDAGAFDVTARGNQGWQVAFCDSYLYAPETMKYRHRNYPGPGAWDPIQTFGNRDAYFNYHSSIDYLGSPNAYGVAYIDDNFDVWFDRLDWPKVSESKYTFAFGEFRAILKLGEAALLFVLPDDIFTSLKIYDAKGALVKDLSGKYRRGTNKINFKPKSNGVYFAILKAGSREAKLKFTIVK